MKKQTKTIEDQGKNQIDALADLKPKQIKPRETKPNEYSDYFLNGLAKIRESYEPVDFNHLTYNVKDLRIPSISFFKSKGPMHIFKGIHTGDTTLEDIEKEKMKLKRDLGRIKQGDPKDKSQEQKKIINNIKNLYNSREEVVRMYNNYAKNMSRNIYKSKQGTGLKKLTPKQMLQRFPIALVQIKAGNNSNNSREVVRMYNNYAKNMSRNIYKSKQGTGLKKLTPKQMLQRFSIALVQIKAGNNSKKLLNEIRQIV